MNGEVGAASRVVVRSIEIKAEVVSKDERESGLRKVLNFGHTLGHAIETAGEYAWPHGSCVALGMILEARLGERMGVTRAGTSETFRRLAALMELPTHLPKGLEPEDILAFTRTDKKGRGGRPQYVLLSETGKVASGQDWAHAVPDEIVLEVLRDASG